MDQEELERRFTYHAPDDETKNVHGWLREMNRRYAEEIAAILGESREMSLFWTNFEQASFWAHAHIARSQADEEG